MFRRTGAIGLVLSGALLVAAPAIAGGDHSPPTDKCYKGCEQPPPPPEECYQGCEEDVPEKKPPPVEEVPPVVVPPVVTPPVVPPVVTPPVPVAPPVVPVVPEAEVPEEVPVDIPDVIIPHRKNEGEKGKTERRKHRTPPRPAERYHAPPAQVPVAEAGQLPYTGIPAGPFIAAGVVLMLGGVLLHRRLAR